jgi:hypothetical protein
MQKRPNGWRFKPAFAKKDKKQTMIGLREIPTKIWFENSIRFSSVIVPAR